MSSRMLGPHQSEKAITPRAGGAGSVPEEKEEEDAGDGWSSALGTAPEQILPGAGFHFIQ